jgi:hypothetical protein
VTHNRIYIHPLIRDNKIHEHFYLIRQKKYGKYEALAISADYFLFENLSLEKKSQKCLRLRRVLRFHYRLAGTVLRYESHPRSPGLRCTAGFKFMKLGLKHIRHIKFKGRRE